jgi:hypothetical protein
MEALALAAERTALHTWVETSALLWPILEIVHFIGLSALLGSMLVIDLRLAGLFRHINIAATHKLLPVAFIGFGLNLTSGTLFFFGNPTRYAANMGFILKMSLVLIAGLNALWFWWKINPLMKTCEPGVELPVLAKIIAGISLGVWFGVLLLGRLIPYVSTG